MAKIRGRQSKSHTSQNHIYRRNIITQQFRHFYNFQVSKLQELKTNLSTKHCSLFFILHIQIIVNISFSFFSFFFFFFFFLYRICLKLKYKKLYDSSVLLFSYSIQGNYNYFNEQFKSKKSLISKLIHLISRSLLYPAYIKMKISFIGCLSFYFLNHSEPHFSLFQVFTFALFQMCLSQSTPNNIFPLRACSLVLL